VSALAIGRGRALTALVCTSVLAAGVALGGPESRAQDPAARGLTQPNVIVVMTDDQNVRDLRIATPETKRRIGGRYGTQFRNAFATFPLCCPSRVSIITGRYAHNHGVVGNNPPDGGLPAYRGTIHEATSAAVALDAAGYKTAWIGKYLNAYLGASREKPPYVSPGFDHWRAASAPRTYYNWTQVIGDRIKLWDRSERSYQTDVYSRQASRFVSTAAKKGQPFFLMLAPFAPHIETRGFHPPINPRPPRRYREKFRRKRLPQPPNFNEADVSDKPTWIQDAPRLDAADRKRIRDQHRNRLGTMAAVDDMVVKLLATLRERRVLGRTLIIFMSDNGYLLGEHRQLGKSKTYDGAVKIPLLMRGPGVPRGEVVRSPAANIDIAATIYDFTGVVPLAPRDGVSLLDVAGDPAEFSDRELVLQTARGFALRTPDYLYSEQEDDLGVPQYELYDLDADPYQLESVHNDPDYAAIRAQLAARLANLRNCSGNACH
jgi:arylsulfatase A-like enzyme